MKVLKLTVLVLVFAVANGLPAYADEILPPDIRKIKERGKLIVAQYSGVQRGFFAFDDSKDYPDRACHMHMGRRMAGCDIALAMKIARTLGVDLELDRSHLQKLFILKKLSGNVSVI